MGRARQPPEPVEYGLWRRIDLVINDFLSRLDKVKQCNGYWMARCPVHLDNNPSLSVSVADDGRILVKCHAGCSTEDIVERVGLKLSDLFYEQEKPSEKKTDCCNV